MRLDEVPLRKPQIRLFPSALGWRVWAYNRGALYSPYIHIPTAQWSSRTHTAACPHQPPLLNCECGVYAMTDLVGAVIVAQHWMRATSQPGMAVLGQVALQYVCHYDGNIVGELRGLTGHIRELFVPKLWAGVNADTRAAALANRYKVPVHADFPNNFKSELAACTNPLERELAAWDPHRPWPAWLQLPPSRTTTWH
jgi:hypothetical protein